MTAFGRLCCSMTWPARKPCDAWGRPWDVHGCKHDPGHEGAHVCPCGARRPKPSKDQPA